MSDDIQGTWEEVFLAAEQELIQSDATIYTILPWEGLDLYGTRVLTVASRKAGAYPTEHGCFVNHEEAIQEMRKIYTQHELIYVSPEAFATLVPKRSR